MKTIFNLKPIHYGAAFLIIISLFSIMYFLIPNILNLNMTIINSIYFSIITITGLGYGDITPISDLGKMITSIQAIFGIFLLGLFLNALSRVRMEEVRVRDIQKDKERYRKKQLSKLNGFYNIFNPHIFNYKKSVIELTNTSVDKDYNKNFEFSDMYQLYDAILTKSENYKSTEVEYYFKTLNILSKELSNLVKSVDLRQFKELEREVLGFLSNTYSFDYSDFIISNVDNAEDIKNKIELFDKEPSFLQDDKDLIPYIALYQQVKTNMEILEDIEAKIKAIL